MTDDPPILVFPAARSINSNVVFSLFSSCGVSVFVTSGHSLKAVITTDIGEATFFSSPSPHLVCIDMESFPTGMLIPSFGHKSIPIVLTDSNKAKSFSSFPAEDIQLAESLISLMSLMKLAAILVNASPTAILADAGALVIAIGAFSPTAKASPKDP